MRSSTNSRRDLSQRDATKYWLTVEIPYRPFYAFEETLAVFGDAPGSPGSMLAAFERLTAVISAQEVTGYRKRDAISGVGDPVTPASS